MKLFLLPSLAIGTLAIDYAPFQIPFMQTHQPNGNPDGQVNYYNIGFNVTSSNGDSPQDAYCATFWGDNGNNWDSSAVPYSLNVPVGEWRPCSVSASELDNHATEFKFQLFPYFAIGNFSVMVKQNFTQTTDGRSSQIIAQSVPYHITNETADYTCEMRGGYLQYQQHTSGDCTTPNPFAGFAVPIANASAACTHADKVALSFPVQESTEWSDEVFVVGNITELGLWDPKRGVLLSALQYTPIGQLWNGGNVSVAAGTSLEYKYLQWSKDGSLLWECGENRVWTVGRFTCGTETAGNDPDYFRCGNH